jgi:hypothetical protein
MLKKKQIMGFNLQLFKSNIKQDLFAPIMANSNLWPGKFYKVLKSRSIINTIKVTR